MAKRMYSARLDADLLDRIRLMADQAGTTTTAMFERLLYRGMTAPPEFITNQRQEKNCGADS